MSRLLIVKEDVSKMNWMKFMPSPLVPNQKVVAHSEQIHADGSPIDSTKYVRVKHGSGAISIFSVSLFNVLGQR